jgi:hypothetical protein
MLQLTDRQVAEYFKRCYITADGLWFMKVEERYGFDTALDIDDDVWKIMPKIQARRLKAMGNLGGGLEALAECLATKLTLDGFVFKMDYTNDSRSIRITITECPWHNLMVKSGREHLSEQVGTRICDTEYRVWAAEFGENLYFELGERICKGAGCCSLIFGAKDE